MCTFVSMKRFQIESCEELLYRMIIILQCIWHYIIECTTIPAKNFHYHVIGITNGPSGRKFWCSPVSEPIGVTLA